MKNYTIHFLLITAITFVLGFSGIEYLGASVVRFICLVSGIGLMISCLDAVILSKQKRKIKKSLKTEKVKSETPAEAFKK